MQLGTDEEISNQAMNVAAAERGLMEAKLRLRALKGEALMQNGDNFSVSDLGEMMELLIKEFGNRNLRMI